MVQRAAEAGDRTTEALAAITSSYRRGRAGIISGEASPSGPTLPTHLPTVPLPFLSHPAPTEVPQSLPADQAGEVPGFWARLVRTRRAASRGRHAPKG